MHTPIINAIQFHELFIQETSKVVFCALYE